MCFSAEYRCKALLTFCPAKYAESLILFIFIFITLLWISCFVFMTYFLMFICLLQKNVFSSGDEQKIN